MVRQRIRTNYYLKDLATVWMTKTQKKNESAAWNNLLPFYWVFEVLIDQGKNKAMKQELFIRIPMEEDCDLNAQFLFIILRE